MAGEIRFRFWWVLPGVSLLFGCGRDEWLVGADDDSAFVPRPTSNDAGERRFVELAAVGNVPGVAGQTTERGRAIGTLRAFGSRVHLGYGDYSGNTGPIASVSYSALRGEFDVGQLLPTEEILEYEEHDGFLFAADLDPRGHEAQGSVFRMSSWDAGWQVMPAIEGAVHTFSMAVYQGRLFAGVGSVLSEPARVVSTKDHGTSWESEHETESPPDGFSRYTHLGATASELFASGRVHAEPSLPFAYLLSNDRWRAVTGVPDNGFLIPLALGADLLVLQFSGDRGKGGEHLATFELVDDVLVENDDGLPDGAKVVNWGIEKRLDERDRVWLLCLNGDERGIVYSAEHLGDWTRIADLPELPNADRFTALAYLDNNLYLASAAGGFYAIRGVFELL